MGEWLILQFMDGYLSLYLTVMHPVWGQCIPSGCTTEDAYLNYRVKNYITVFTSATLLNLCNYAIFCLMAM